MPREPRRYGGSPRTGAVLDVETTGLNPYRDEVIELAVILFRFTDNEVDKREGVQEYVGLREPARMIPPHATRVHGITLEDVVGRHLDERQIRSLVSRAEFIVAHNVHFDRPFVEGLLPEIFVGKRWLCTMRNINWKRRGASSRRLERLARHFGLSHENAHRALGDARTTLDLLSVADGAGRTVLEEMLK